MTDVKLPAELQPFVLQVGPEVTPAEIEVYGRLQTIQDRSYRLRTVLDAWRRQQDEDRKMRRSYANWLMIAMCFQLMVINVSYLLMGARLLIVEPWTAKTFIMSAFAEIAALVLVVVKYLFAAPSDTVLKLVQNEALEETR